jgi:hypothetical protein
MGNYSEAHDKIVVHLKEVYKKHRNLDEKIKVCYNKREDELIINRMKTQKLWLKDEIHRLETALKELG